jgi:hypothetical protein
MQKGILMRKIFRPALITAVVILINTAAVFAGDISNIAAVDTMEGITGGAAIGALTALGPYLDGKNPAVFGASAGIGSLIGAGIGLSFGIWQILNRQQSGKPVNTGAICGDLYVQAEDNGIKLIQKF